MRELFFPAVGIMSFIIGFYNLFIYLKLTNGNSASAKVVDYKVETDTKGRKILFPIVEFTTSDGQVIKESNQFGNMESEILKMYPIDTAVNIRYNPKKPKTFMIEGDKSALKNVIILIAIGAVILIYCIFRYL